MKASVTALADSAPATERPLAWTESQGKSLLEDGLMALFSVPAEPSADQKQLWERVLTIFHTFLGSENVSTSLDLQSLAAQFVNSRSPDEAVSVGSYLDYLEEKIIPHSINMSSPRCMGHMTSVLPHFAWVLGELIIALNQNLVKREASKSLTLLERQTMAILHRLIYGYGETFYNQHVQRDDSTLGIMISGGTLANITALWIARNSCFGPANGFAGIEDEGIPAALKFYDCDGAVIIGSSLMHYSMDKASSLLGFGARSLLKIPVREDGRVDVSIMRETVESCLSRRHRIIALVGVAGTTDCGSIDPLAELAEIAEAAGTHFHVDAAWGAPLLFSQRHRHKLDGIERADSITADGHKQLYLPIGSSMLLLRDPSAAKTIEKQTRYMLQEGSGDLGKRSLEGSRPGAAMLVHAALHIIGAKGYEFLTDESIRKARLMAEMIRSRPEFELLVETETNILLYRYIPEPWREALAQGSLSCADNHQINAYNKSIQKAQFEAGRTFVSRTTWEKSYDGMRMAVVALRAVIGNPFTTAGDMELVLEDQLMIAAELQIPHLA